MSDNLRQNPSDKIMNAITPDAQKTWTEKKGAQIASKADEFASHAEPEGQKSTTQKIVDTVTPGNSSHPGDSARQGPLDATRAAVVPDALKSDSQYHQDQVKGKADNLGSHVQPEHDKSIVQKIKDFVTPGSSSTHATHDHSTHTHAGHDHSAHGSDAYRQDNTSKISAAIVPDALKSDSQYHGDQLKGNTDNLVGHAVPHEQKTFGQKVADSVNPNSSA